MSVIGKAQLAFNYIAKIKASKQEIAQYSSLVENLPSYKSGRPVKPGSGFEKLDLGVQSIQSEFLRRKLENVSGIRHVYESFSGKVVFTTGSKKGSTGRVLKIHSTDLYWIQPSLLAIAGAENDVIQSLEWFKKETKLKSNQIKFDPHFLIWLIYRLSNDPELSPNLRIDLIKNATTEGAIDLLGRKTIVEDCLDVSRAIQTVVTILGGKKVSQILCGFSLMGSWRIITNIDERGKIAFRASKASLKYISVQERIQIALVTLQEIIDIYEQWERSKPTTKYPPSDFFAGMAAAAEREGTLIFSSAVQKLIERFENLRKGKKK